ncbi:MAG: UDP-glucose 4-epimerase GalE [Candidatus Levybacteria bacterium CG_4_9_14_3_um_filter_35_16]|nr:MAG: UDP-glucose 4-epimerase GalE [Candidatus Levybacteria bacterium CG22_combo_CG10-13_8_21_14_all_35_11]PJA91452.1 MAG: UDP-glucose 4-epimerase GalE [Candidatus Levybacteria bacterium CG_4_9_14_3_um_filter_35_16]PJC54524.1 MAG: UDP-glucose 4-epimerase GalE [Candidatus Levybacteria bacterium CG_4_9_14_0_2_um_filter_35_21]
MKILVTGGAGYIGSFMVKRLLEKGDNVIVVDSLERGHISAIDKRAEFIKGNLQNRQFVSEVLSKKFDAVIHFAGFISMEESMEEPYMYFKNNTVSSLNLIEEMVRLGNNNIIFSSTAGVYGNPVQIPIPEYHPKNPENPYGESKLMVEKLLHWYGKTKKLNSAVLRYFNAAGAARNGSLGEQHVPETHIIPKIMEAVIEKKPFKLFGSDYETEDGTCVRDYIHVLDLVEAHVLALEKLIKDPGHYVYNVGTGKGYSNKQIVSMVKKITESDLKIVKSSRRPGDADTLIADSTKIKNELGFSPKHSSLETIVKTAWQWHSKKA